jgi:hypothetical protein
MSNKQNEKNKKLLQLYVSNDFNVPEIYYNGSNEQIESALWLGGLLSKSGGFDGPHNYIDKIKELHEKIAHIMKEKAEIEVKLEAVLVEKNEVIAALEKEEKKNIEYNNVVEKIEELKKEIYNQKSFKKIYKKELCSYENSKQKGVKYEQTFKQLLIQAFGLCKGFQLRETCKLITGHEMDFCMNLDEGCVMWEVKNYSNVVPKCEVNKFLRDLRENRVANIGIMVSRNSDIYNKSIYGPMHVEFEGDVMIIYLSQFNEDMGVLRLLGVVFRIWWKWLGGVGVGVGDGDGEINYNKSDIIKIIGAAIEDIGCKRNEWRRHKIHIDEMTRWVYDMISDQQMRLNNILQKVCEGHSKRDVYENIFKRSAVGNELFAQIMNVCTVCRGARVEIRELVHCLCKKVTGVSKDLLRVNILQLLRDGALIKDGTIQYINGLKLI